MTGAKPRVPEPDWLRLPEAVTYIVDLVGADRAAVREALGRALGDGRIYDRPQPPMPRPQAEHMINHMRNHEARYRDLSKKLGLNDGDLAESERALLQMTIPQSTGASAWRRWLNEGAVNWNTGEVVKLITDGRGVQLMRFIPELGRADLCGLFNVDRPGVRRLPPVTAPNLLKFLTSQADGVLTESQLRERAKRHFSNYSIPVRRWREVWRNPVINKRKPGDTDKGLKRRG